MSSNKLPSYFEKYFEQKFSDINVRFDGVGQRIDELKLHVNDELSALRKEVQNFRRQMLVVWGLIIILLIIHIDQFGPVFLASIRKFIGL